MSVSDTIIAHLGGVGGIHCMLGRKAQIIISPLSVSLRFPQRTPKRGNVVCITLEGEDLYTMEVFRVGKGVFKEVFRTVRLRGALLIPMFEAQTGLALRVPRVLHLTSGQEV
jgi:hypothetical protein